MAYRWKRYGMTKISDSLTDKIIELRKIEKWDGVMPKVTGSSAIIQMDSEE